MFFSVLTKNLNWEILTKNLVTFKRWTGVKDKNFDIMEVHWKIQFLGRVSPKNNIWGNYLKREGGLDRLQI